ncbi:MAG: hypothetical protein M3Q07_26250, partial [Pseudobdellovibrionaceae bacterium]|nr:hypothetical protein [Pseudobdellovibrionaceae bacterium]
TVENGKSYTVVGQIQGVDESIPAPVLKLVIEAALPQPPDASMCASKCSNTSIWYDGPYKGGANGSYSSMVPGKWSCMKHEGKPDPIGAPIFSFDPANNCEQEGPVGFRDKAKGCFAADTLIRMGDGRLQKIQDIMPGDRIWNPLLQKAFRVKQVKAGPETQELLRLSFAGRRHMIVTPDHPFLDQWGTVVQAKDLASMLTPEGMHSVVSAEVLTSGSPVPVFNLEIDAPADNPRAHFLEANGAVAGDLFLQNSLKGQHALTLFDEPGALSSEAIFFARASEF